MLDDTFNDYILGTKQIESVLYADTICWECFIMNAFAFKSIRRFDNGFYHLSCFLNIFDITILRAPCSLYFRFLDKLLSGPFLTHQLVPAVFQSIDVGDVADKHG